MSSHTRIEESQVLMMLLQELAGLGGDANYWKHETEL